MAFFQSTTSPATDRSLAITDLYQAAFPSVARFVRRQGGELDTARDLFQEALVIYWEKVMIDGFQPNQSHQAYLFGIARKLWLRKREKPHPSSDLLVEAVQEPADESPAIEKILRFLAQAGQKCMDLLQAFYYEQLPMRELAERFGYRNERSATVQKYKCLEKVRDQVREKSMTYADFLT